MSVAEKTIEFIEDVYRGFAAFLALSPEFIVDWQTVVPPNTIVSNKGDMISFIRLEGFCGLAGGDELENIIQGMSTATASLFSKTGVELTFLFRRDEFHPDEIHKILQPSFESAARMQLDLQDVLKSKAKVIARWTRNESSYIMIRTKTSSLTKSELKSVSTKCRSDAKKYSISTGIYACYPRIFYELLFNRHRALVEALITEFNQSDIRVSEFPVHDVLAFVRRTLMPNKTDLSWRPCLPGDPVPVRTPMRTNARDKSHVGYPAIATQLFPEGAGESIGPSYQNIGDYVFAPAKMLLAPQIGATFNQLFSTLRAADIPYLISITFRAGVMSTLNKNLASGLAWLPGTTNKKIVNAYDEVEQRFIAGELMAGVQVMGCTWSPRSHGAEITRRQSLLIQALQSWGAAEVSGLVGDPLCGVCASLGLTETIPAPTSIPALQDAFRMCPIARPVSPWTAGAMPLRTGDGKLLPFQPGSDLQTAWVVLGFAPMGFGKSVFFNALNEALILSPGATSLPYLSIMDIGPSGSGIVSMIKSGLPKDMQHLAQYVRLSMTAKHAINVFDTPLGLRTPLPAHRDFLCNFMSLVCMSARDRASYPNMDGLIRIIVDRAYDNLKDNISPKPYDSSICPPEVLKVLDTIGFKRDQQSTWWEVVDLLFSKGFTHEAMLAQRYAVPTLGYCGNVVRQDGVGDIYKDKTPGDIPIVDYIWRQIMEGVNMFPNLSCPTQFDLGETRVCVMDLEDVAPKGNDSADRQTAIMYMVARHITSSKFFMREEELMMIPEPYRSYHRPIIQELSTAIKGIGFDEFHRTSHAPAVVDQVERDIREGRKRRILISLFSQQAEDFNKTIVNLATSIFILGAGSEENIKGLQSSFGLSDTETRFVRNITKPSSKGSAMLSIHITSKGRVTQPTFLTLAPEEMWAFSSTAKDTRVRRMLYERIDPGLARRVLAARYPGGSLGLGDREVSAGDYEQIVAELLEDARRIEK